MAVAAQSVTGAEPPDAPGGAVDGLRVGINLLYLVPGAVGGTETYARELLRALAAAAPGTEFVAICLREAAASLAELQWPANVRIVGLPLPAAVKPLRVLVEWTVLPLIAWALRVDLLHSFGTTSPPVGGRGVRLVTVHDLIHEAFPANFSRVALLGLKLLVPAGARRATRVIADSESTRRDVIRLLGVPAARVDVVHLGLGMPRAKAATPEAELRERLRLGERPVLLCVSALLPHKNLARLLEALRIVADGRSPRPVLVVPGHRGRIESDLREHAGRAGVAGDVRFTGWIPAGDLEGLYALAAGFVYPSLYEGFGLPVLEAMRRGVPVACSDATSLPEVAADAALLFAPEDVRAMAAAMDSLLDDPRIVERLVVRGRERAARFTWQSCAEATLRTYARALGRLPLGHTPPRPGRRRWGWLR